ncbi:MAG: AMP-binding protein [Deltaproteobacteria bacterium]|nr:AMP-binding protein [Deltaproteobacteria bacterium]
MGGQLWHKSYPRGIPTEISLDNLTHVANLLEQACTRYASRTAMSCMGSSLTYEELNTHASWLAGYLQSIGIRKADRVALMLPNLPQFAVAFLAVQKIGAVCVNTNPLYTPREMQHQFGDSGAVAIIILDLFLDKLEKILLQTQIKNIVSVSIGDYLPVWKRALLSTVLRIKGALPNHSLSTTSFLTALTRGRNKPHQPVTIEPDDLCMLQYTGGTTGISKGAMLTHRNVQANVRQINVILAKHLVEGEECVLTALPLYHIFALTVNLLSMVNIGAESVLVPKPIPIKNTAKLFKKYKVTAMTGVNTLFNALNNCPLFRQLAPKSLKIVVGGGMSVQEVVSRQFEKITGVPIIEGYGLTESSPVTHINPFEGNRPIGSIGLPLPSTEAKIINEKEQELPIGESGELIIRGPQVMKGYWQRELETAQVLKNGWLHTGDVAKIDSNGFFYIVDRKKDMILVSGFNVYPNEVEAVLANHPKVLEAAVVGVADSQSGEAVKAFIVAKDPSLSEQELRSFCEDQLTGYKRPRQYEFRKELPKTNVGKILRRELKNS